jgi:enoyl-CoA hydratase/carnithine racemase
MPRPPGLTAACAGGVCTLTLDEPERLNPLNEAVRRRLDAALRRVAGDASVRVVVLRGAGRAFSGGADLAGRTGEPPGWSERRRLAGGWQRTLAAFEALPQPAVASLHGWVVGGARCSPAAATCAWRRRTCGCRSPSCGWASR